MHTTTISNQIGGGSMNLKKSRKECMGGFRGRKGKEKCCNQIIISKIKINKYLPLIYYIYILSFIECHHFSTKIIVARRSAYEPLLVWERGLFSVENSKTRTWAIRLTVLFNVILPQKLWTMSVIKHPF